MLQLYEANSVAVFTYSENWEILWHFTIHGFPLTIYIDYVFSSLSNVTKISTISKLSLFSFLRLKAFVNVSDKFWLILLLS